MILEEVDEDENRRRKRRKKKSGNAKNAFGSIGITIPNSDEEDEHSCFINNSVDLGQGLLQLVHQIKNKRSK